MADVEAAPSGADAPQPVAATEQPAEKPVSNGDAPIAKQDIETAGKEATTEVSAPDGNGTTEVAVGPSSDAPEAATSASKEKKRKSSSGVPEHKSKKLNKKKSTPTLRLDCKPGDLYWARLKGYPPWPSVICDEEMLPETLLASRPVSAARPDGSLREDFQDGGKNAKDRTFPIMFLSTNEFSWLVNTGLTPLDPEECKNPTAKLGKSLADAYRIASEKPDLDYFKGLLQQFQEETAALEAAQREREAEAEEKAAAKAKKDAEKKARKSKGGDDDVDMADADGAKSSKKRKKEADSDGDGSKSKKTPKITKLNAPKTPNGESAKKSGAASKPKKKVTAPKDDDADADAQAPMTESERLAHREKLILFLRHKLQKAFLSRETAPKEDEMPGMSEFFKQLEGHEDLEPELIRKTKIHKVLKGIVKLDHVPLDDEYNFKKRSQNMLETWNRRMEQDADIAPRSAVPVESAATTNGDSHAAPEEPKKVEAAAEKQADEIDQKIETVEKIEEPAEESKPAAEPTETKQPEVEQTADESAQVKQQEPQLENAGEASAAPDAKPAADADGDVKMSDNAAGNSEHA